MELTNKQAVETYLVLETQYSQGIPLDTHLVEELAEAIIASVVIRDYVMGQAPASLTTEGALSFITELLPHLEEGKRYPLYTIMSGYYYELGDSELAFASLMQAQLLNPEYSLANLLSRVFQAGWAKDAFPQMRNELHPKVVADLIERADELVTA